MDGDLVEEVRKLVQFLFGALGPDRTLLLIFGLIVLLAIRRVYLDWRATKLTNEALAEKERTIQRIASQERQWRVYFMMKEGRLSQGEAERVVLQNDFSTPREARTALEEKKKKDGKRKPKG